MKTTNECFSPLTADTMTEFKEIFRLFDEDQDGVVTSDEVSVIMRSLGVSISDGELRHMISQYRAHGKGQYYTYFISSFWLYVRVVCGVI